MKFTAAKCPACNGDLQVPDEMDFVFCMYCKTQIKVRDSLLVKNDIDPENQIELGYSAIKHRNFEEGIEHLNKVLERDIKNNKAWWGKGMACMNSSGGDLYKMEEGLSYLLKANELSNDEEKKIIKDNIMDGLQDQELLAQHIDFLFKVFESFGSDDERILTKIINLTNSLLEDTTDLCLTSELREKQVKALTLLEKLNRVQYEKLFGKTVKTDEFIYSKKKLTLENYFKQINSFYFNKYITTFIVIIAFAPIVLMIPMESYGIWLYLFLVVFCALCCKFYLHLVVIQEMRKFEKEKYGENIIYKQ